MSTETEKPLPLGLILTYTNDGKALHRHVLIVGGAIPHPHRFHDVRPEYDGDDGHHRRLDHDRVRPREHKGRQRAVGFQEVGKLAARFGYDGAKFGVAKGSC